MNHKPTACWNKPDRTLLERLVETVLDPSALKGQDSGSAGPLGEDVLDFDVRETRVVVLGGGTGLSTVVGGNSQTGNWPDQPFVGLKEEFPRLEIVVGTTDDGGSTGKLRRQLPIIGIGDLRKSLVSLIRLSSLQRTYGMARRQALEFIRLVRDIFNYRFPDDSPECGILQDPLLAAAASLRGNCPGQAARFLRSLGRCVSPGGSGPTIDPAGHCLGNLLMTAAIFREAGYKFDRPPGMQAIRSGLRKVSLMIGAPPGRLHPATATPGQLKFHYANGVEVYGQRKSAVSRRGYPVQWLIAEFAGAPKVSAEVCRAIREADLIVYAPGSIYSSILPLLQLRPLVSAIRANRRALKILGANFWNQEGETDISLRHESRGFLVSDLIEAYDRNVTGGMRGLFDIILSANLEHLPGDILRDYALEGKSPIHLDREQVRAMGFEPVEATLFSSDFSLPVQVVHHDPFRFARAIRALWYAWNTIKGVRRNIGRKPAAAKVPGSARRRASTAAAYQPVERCSPLLSEYLAAIEDCLQGKEFSPSGLGSTLRELIWENRDISPSHLGYFDGAAVVPAHEWNRNTAWDNVLGYYDPQDRRLKVHESLAARPGQLQGDLLIALGESLLGCYIESRDWIECARAGTPGTRCYEIRLRPPRERRCCLTEAQLRRFLGLARMVPDATDPWIYRITINHEEGFLPPGLLFGLMYAWYLNNSYAIAMEYEMSQLRWPESSLIPHQAKERMRKQALVDFFRSEIFGHRGGAPRAPSGG